jgi:hypothetical protein
MKYFFIFLFVGLFCLAGCTPSFLEGRYYNQNNMLEITSLLHQRFAFQILATASRKAKYVSGKANYVSANQYYYEGETQKLIFEFEDNYVKITQIDSSESGNHKHFEGTYYHLKLSDFYEPTEHIIKATLKNR